MGLQGYARNYRDIKGITNMGVQEYRRDYSGIEGFTRDYKGFQRITEDYNGMQRYKKVYKELQWITGVSRDCRG